MAKKQKLELTWIDKDDVVHLEPRALIESPGLSYIVPHVEIKVNNGLFYFTNIYKIGTSNE